MDDGRIWLQRRDGSAIEASVKDIGRIDRQWVEPWIHKLK